VLQECLQKIKSLLKEICNATYALQIKDALQKKSFKINVVSLVTLVTLIYKIEVNIYIYMYWDNNRKTCVT